MWAIRSEVPMTLAIFAEQVLRGLCVYGLVFGDRGDVFLQQITIKDIVSGPFTNFADFLMRSVRGGAA